MRMFRGFYGWTGEDETETLRQRCADLEALLAEANQSIAYWKNRYENEASSRRVAEQALGYTESATVNEDASENWYDLLEGYAQ